MGRCSLFTGEIHRREIPKRTPVSSRNTKGWKLKPDRLKVRCFSKNKGDYKLEKKLPDTFYDVLRPRAIYDLAKTRFFLN